MSTESFALTLKYNTELRRILVTTDDAVDFAARKEALMAELDALGKGDLSNRLFFEKVDCLLKEKGFYRVRE